MCHSNSQIYEVKMEEQEIREKILPDDYRVIAEKLKGRYAKRTIRAQLTGERTLKDIVRQAAEELIRLREEFINA